MENFVTIVIRLDANGKPTIRMDSDLPPDTVVALMTDLLEGVKRKAEQFKQDSNAAPKIDHNGSAGPDPA